MQKHKDCYGTMFHDSLHVSENQDMKGKAFDFKLSSMGLGTADRAVSVKMEEWDDCVACEEFEHCYKLCAAKLMLESAIRRA